MRKDRKLCVAKNLLSEVSQEENQDRMLSLKVDDEEVCCTTDTSGRGPGHFLAIARGSQEIATGLNRAVSRLRYIFYGQ